MDVEGLRDLCSSVLPSIPSVNTAYLFGSRAKGADSPRDYDIAILFDEGRVATREAMYRASDGVYAALHRHLRPLDVVELNSAGDLLVTQVLKCKSILYCADRQYRVAWETRVRYKIWDMRPFGKLYEEAAFRRIREMKLR